MLQVGACKAKIEEVHGYEASSQKIIFSGKILTDEDTFGGAGVKDNDFVVCMTKPKVRVVARTRADVDACASAVACLCRRLAGLSPPWLPPLLPPLLRLPHPLLPRALVAPPRLLRRPLLLPLLPLRALPAVRRRRVWC